MFKDWLKQTNASAWLDVLLIAYLYWVAFEWMILSRLGSYALIQSIRNTIDIIPIVFFIVCLIILNPRLRTLDLKIFLSFIAIILLSTFSLILERQNPSSVIGYIGVTFRFVPLILLVRFTSDRFRFKLIRHVKIIFWLLAGLAIISLLGREAFNELFLPPADFFGEVLPTAYTDPGISATFINTVEFSFFMLGLTILYLNASESPVERFWVSLVSLVLIVLSFSIASVLGLFLVFFIRSRRKWLVGSILTGTILVAFLGFSRYIQELLGMDIRYWIDISSEFNRLGYFTKVLPEFLHGGLKDIFLGMGDDSGVVDMKLAGYHNTPFVMINNENNLKYLKDVYWLSILLVQGLIAFVLTFYILATIYKAVRNHSSNEDFLMIQSFLLVIVFLGLFNQVMDIKGITYLFWLTTAVVTDFAFNRQCVYETA